jgi:hypothetical protein
VSFSWKKSLNRPVNEGFQQENQREIWRSIGKMNYKWGIFQLAMFDCRGAKLNNGPFFTTGPHGPIFLDP